MKERDFYMHFLTSLFAGMVAGIFVVEFAPIIQDNEKSFIVNFLTVIPSLTLFVLLFGIFALVIYKFVIKKL